MVTTVVYQLVTVAIVVAICVAYLRAAFKGDSSSAQTPTQTPTPLQRVSFIGGFALLLFTVVGPLHSISSNYLFGAHTIQVLIITLVVPPLVLAGTPGWMLRPLVSNAKFHLMLSKITGVRTCFVVFNVAFAAWHLPLFFNAALTYTGVHFLLYATMFAASIIMWWPLMSPLPELPRAPYPIQMLYCFLMVIPMSLVSIYIAMADGVLYPKYELATRIIDITPIRDQQYGGLIMWIPGGVFFYAVMTVVFFKWSSRGGDDQATAQVGWQREP